MVAPVFREPAFVWACVALMGGCALVALVVRQRKFLLGISEQFARLPPSTKAVIVTAVVFATVFAQKPTNVPTNQHESARVEEVSSATPAETPRLPSSATSRPLARTAHSGPCGATLGRRIASGSPSAKVPPETLCASAAHVFSDSNLPTLSSNDVVRGYRLETVRTTAADFSKRPPNARLVGTWHLTDAYRGRARVMLGGGKEKGRGKKEEVRTVNFFPLPSSFFLWAPMS